MDIDIDIDIKTKKGEEKPFSKEKPILKELECFIPLFIENRQKDLATLQKALAHGDFQKIWQVGHLLKGICAPYGFSEMGALGEQLQVLAEKKESHHLKKKVEQMEQMVKDSQRNLPPQPPQDLHEI